MYIPNRAATEWYLAKMVFRIVCSNGNHAPQFDEQLRLIAATSTQEAFRKATILGETEQQSFLNQQQQWVRWQFINIAEVVRIGKLEDGAELHYHIAEPDDAAQYIELIHAKAARIFSGEKSAASH